MVKRLKEKIKENLVYKDWTILNSFGLLMIIGASFLILEHYFKWGVLDLSDYIGHEYTALGMFIIGFLLLSKQANNWFRKFLRKKERR